MYAFMLELSTNLRSIDLFNSECGKLNYYAKNKQIHLLKHPIKILSVRGLCYFLIFVKKSLLKIMACENPSTIRRSTTWSHEHYSNKCLILTPALDILN